MKKIELSHSTLKFLIIFVLVLLFLIPISLIKNLINDRQDYKRDAVFSITEPLGRNAAFQGLVIAVPYKSYREYFDTKGTRHEEVETKYVIFAPDSYNMDFTVNPYYLTRGIFKVLVYNGEININADFDSFDYSYFGIKEKDFLWNEAVLILGLTNSKNLTKQPEFVIGGKKLNVSPIKYDAVSPFVNSVYYRLSEIDFSQKLHLSGNIAFQGGESIMVCPVAAENTITMKSSWQSPSFSGGWLPKERSLSKDGFSAEWNIAGLSTVFPKSWLAETKFNAESITVSFIVPVDAYKKTTRSVKYALLFLIIPFLALLICEIFAGTKIHPVQYCLIGSADVIFYLLLLAISEHIPFDITYFICALAVSIATFFYASAIFKKIKWGGLVSLVQLISYIFLYGTLQAEDYALLIGSLGLFGVLLLLMFITRKIDWYKLNENTQYDNN